MTTRVLLGLLVLPQAAWAQRRISGACGPISERPDPYDPKSRASAGHGCGRPPCSGRRRCSALGMHGEFSHRHRDWQRGWGHAALSRTDSRRAGSCALPCGFGAGRSLAARRGLLRHRSPRCGARLRAWPRNARGGRPAFCEWSHAGHVPPAWHRPSFRLCHRANAACGDRSYCRRHLRARSVGGSRLSSVSLAGRSRPTCPPGRRTAPGGARPGKAPGGPAYVAHADVRCWAGADPTRVRRSASDTVPLGDRCSTEESNSASSCVGVAEKSAVLRKRNSRMTPRT